MQRVLFYDDAPIHGGHQITAIAAARRLAAAGLEVFSAFPADNARLRDAWERGTRGVHLVPLELRLTRWQPFLAPFGVAAAPVRALLTRVRPDIVVAVQGSIVQANRIVEQARRRGIAVVSFIPTALHFPPRARLQARVGRVLARHHYRRPDAFLTISEASRRELLADGARAPIHVAYFGRDWASMRRESRAAARRRLAIGAERYVVALIARLTIDTKGHDLLIEAAAALRDEVPGLTVLFAGDGPDEERLEQLIGRAGVGDLVRRLPWLDDMTDVYAAADVVAIPSRWEGLPLVATEAMFHERRVAAADVGALGEMFPPSWLFRAGDAAALADAIRRARTEDARELLARNRARVLHELTEEKFGEAFTAVLRRVWSARRR